jgi:hypothetical protein
MANGTPEHLLAGVPLALEPAEMPTALGSTVTTATVLAGQAERVA